MDEVKEMVDCVEIGVFDEGLPLELSVGEGVLAGLLL